MRQKMQEIENLAEEKIDIEIEAPSLEAKPDQEEPQDDEIEISIKGDAPSPEVETEQEQPAPSWVRELRKKNRELERQNRDLQSRLTTPIETKPIDVKPKLEDFDYDTEQFTAALDVWMQSQHKKAAEEAKRKAEEEEVNKAWAEKLKAYETAKESIKVKDYDRYEQVVEETFSQIQQGILLEASDNPAYVVYAIGRNPDRAKKLAEIKNPIKLAAEIAKIEKDLIVTNKKLTPPPPPEKTISGTGRTISGDSTLEKLRAQAEKSGDYTKVIEYKRKLNSK